MKLQIQGDLSRFSDARTLALRLSQRGDMTHENFDNYHVEDHEEEYQNMYGEWNEEWHQDPWFDNYYDEFGEESWEDPEADWWYGYEEEQWHDEGEPWDQEHYDEGQSQSPPTADATLDQQNHDDYYKGKGKNRNAMGVGCETCGSKWHSTVSCPVNSGGKGKTSHYGGKSYGKSFGKGKFGKSSRFGKGKNKSYEKGSWYPRRFGKGKGYGKNYGGKGKRRYYADQYFSHAPRGSLDISYTKKEKLLASDAPHRPSTTTTYYRMDSGEDLLSRDKSYHLHGSTASTDENKTEKISEKVLSFAMFLGGTRSNASYHTIRGEKRRGLLIDPGAASGLIGSETLRDLMQHCIPEDQQDECVSWSSRTTSVAGISGASDETLGEVSIKLNTSSRSISYKGDVIGGDGSLCPALVGNPTLRQQQAALFSDWFPCGDGLLVIHREEMLGPDKKPILLRLLLTDSGHYLLPTDDKSSTEVSKETSEKVAFMTNNIIRQSLEQWPDEKPRLRHCFHTQDQAETDRSEKSSKEDNDHSSDLHTAGGNHSDIVGRGTCPGDLCYPMKPTSGCEPLAGGSVKQVTFKLDEEQRNSICPTTLLLTQPISRKEDRWVIDGHWLIREHHVSRRTMFTPACSKNCPVKMTDITSTRHTEIFKHPRPNGVEECNQVIEDDWKDCQVSHRDLGFPWIGRTYFLIHDHYQEYWQNKKDLESWLPPYHEDHFPRHFDEDKIKSLRQEYRSMPEEFYTKSGKRPVTPDNVELWLKEVQSKHDNPSWHFVELYSGSGRLSLAMAAAGLNVGFPIDLRYGWDLNNESHQWKLLKVFNVMKPGVIFASPRCKFHSTASNTMDPEKKALGRQEDESGLEFVKKVFVQQAHQKRGYAAEQPWGSTLWNESPLKPEELPGCRNKQRCDQCMLGASDEHQQPIQKATGLISNFKFRKTCKRCSGHRGKPHAHLQGKLGGLNRTSLAAVYPRGMCQEMCKDVIAYLEAFRLLKTSAWPRSLQHVWHSHMYKCLRCQLGRASPQGIEHSLIPGECRHGVYPTPDGKRPRALPPDPINEWKKKARTTPLEEVQFELPKNFTVKPEETVYWKTALFQLVQDALSVIEEATKAGVESSHWVTDQTLMAVIRGLLQDVMHLKGIRVCLRPWNMATPEPQLFLHSTPLRIQIHGTMKHWIMDEMEDLTTCSQSQINREIDIDDWQVTLFGSDKDQVETGKKTAKGTTSPTTPTIKTSSPSTPSTATSSRPTSSPTTPRTTSSPTTPLLSSSSSSTAKKRTRQAVADEEAAELLAPREPAAEEDEAVFEEEKEEVFIPRQIVSKKPLYDFKKVFQRLPQLAENNPQTAVRLLLGLHEKYWHAPPHDLRNLLARAGMPMEVLNLVGDAVMKCQICRRYVRLPNRPQHKMNNAGTFNQCVQADMFKLLGSWILILIDEATRYKVATVVESRESAELQQKLLDHWMRYFGPPASLVMDQEASLMSHETAAEFERLSIERKPKGTTAGTAGKQHTGTGLIERHVGLLKLTILKIKAELDRQGIVHEVSEIAMEAAMAQNSTLNYGGVTPAMAVFGILLRGFYDDEAAGLLASAGALQTDLTTFEKALRVRQISLSAVQQAIVEDRTARANRTRSHRLDASALVPGTSEVEFYREVQGDVGWRGPAKLLLLDADEGVAVIQYQGRPYLVAIRHIRPHVETYSLEQSTLKLSDDAEDELYDLMKMIEQVPMMSKRMLGYIPEQTVNGTTWRKTPSEEHFKNDMFDKAKTISTSLTTRQMSGIIYGRGLKYIKPPKNTTGYLITWTTGSLKYGIMEHWSGTSIKSKKVTSNSDDNMCVLYFFYHVLSQEEETAEEWRRSNSERHQMDQDIEKPLETESMETTAEEERMSSQAQSEDDDALPQPPQKREGPESRTVVIAPERKKQRFDYWASHSTYYNVASLQHLLERRQVIKTALPSVQCGPQPNVDNDEIRRFLINEELYREQGLKDKGNYLFHIGASTDAVLHVDIRTSDVWRVDTEHDDINEDDVVKVWPLVEEADRSEVEQFVQENAFKKIHRLEISESMVVIDARWVRKWKKLADGKKKVKSRLCARGCLDRQKDLLTTRSTTATRLSQRLLLSLASTFDMEVESWDIAGAFLKGLNFSQIRDMLRDMGVDSPLRQVIIIPPMNVWRHLATSSSYFKVNNPADWALLCLKPIYGLNDAPLAWQLSLHSYLRDIRAHPSLMDENSWRWKKDDGSLLAMCTCHVDDVAIAGPKWWLEEHYKAFVKKFKKVTRQQLPFEHCGAKYEKVGNGYRMIQADFCSKMKPVGIDPKKKDNERLQPEEVTSYRSILGALLWLTATRLDIIADVSQLASYVTTAEIRHLRMANQVLKRAQQQDFRDVGIYFMKLNPSRGLRLACFHDSSSFTKEKSFAQEGVIVMLMEDNVTPIDGQYDVTCDDLGAADHGGRAHILWSHGAKAKRISYSTSHAETLAAISGNEASVMVSVRISEVLHPSERPTLQQLAAIQEAGNPQLPVDDYGDCNDVFQLVTMGKTLPQDKTQRIYVLSLRESRLSGRVRWMALVPTQSMIADVLTKSMHAPQMLTLLTSGILEIKNEETHHLQAKRLPPKFEIEEKDLFEQDEELIHRHQQETKSYDNMWWTPMMASMMQGKIPAVALLMLSSLPISEAAETTEKEDGENYYLISFLVATIVVLMTERMLKGVASWLFGQADTISWTPTTLGTPSTARSNQSTQTDDATASYGTATGNDQGVQAKPFVHDKNLQFDGEKVCDSKHIHLERELRQACDTITKINLDHEKHARELLGRAMTAEAKYDRLKLSTEARGQSTDTSHLEIPDHIFVTTSGESFHRSGCPSLTSAFQPRPQKKLAKCKRCF